MPEKGEILFKYRLMKVLLISAISLSFVGIGVFWSDIGEVIVNGSILCLSCIGIG